MFSCVREDTREIKQCRGHKISPCRGNQVSKFFCNEHAEIFHLYYQNTFYQNGNDDTWTSIDTFVTGTGLLNIPLFLDSNCEVLMSEIKTFALSAKHRKPNIDVRELENMIACYMNLTAYDNCVVGGWLDDSSTKLIVQTGDTIQSLSYIPPLHKMLFFYTKPAILRNESDGSQVYLVPNVSLQSTMNTSSAQTYQFTIPNREYMLKYADQLNNLATPVVLNAIRVTTVQQQQSRKFKHIKAPNILC